MFPLAIATAVVIMAFWFPVSSLWHQQSQLSSLTAQIAAVRQQESSLKTQAKQVTSTAAEEASAREQYQLVSPGQSLIQVLPGNGTGTVTQATGDPGLSPLVSPSALAPTAASASTTKVAAPQGFVARVLHTLEFWR